MAGKHITPKKRHWAPFVVVLAVAALVATIGGTMAWLTTYSAGLTNTFTPAEVEIQVEETVENNTKTSITVNNIGGADAYIRVTLVSNWGKMVGDKWVVCGDTSHNHSNFTFNTNDLGDNWIEIGGYYYYTSPVKHGNNTTSNLLGKKGPEQVVIPLNQDEENDCIQQVTVLAQAIQAEGVNAEGKRPVELAWGVTVNADGTISK